MPNSIGAVSRYVAVVFILFLVGFSNVTFAASSRSPVPSYGGYNTPTEYKQAVYALWINVYGKTGCGFGQWTWWGDATSISGIPSTNEACGSGHVANSSPITKVCPVGYLPNNPSAPTICTLPDNTIDPSKEKGTPDDGLSCAAKKSTGNPINFATGNKFQTEVDYVGPGSYPLTLVRKYNSQDGIWRHNYSARLRIGTQNVVLIASDGRESYFSLNGNIATPELNELGALVRDGGVWVYTSTQQEKTTFDNEGRLVRIARSDEEFQTIVYENDLAFTVTDNLGNTLVFTASALAQGQPLKLITNDTQINYGYDSSRNLSVRSLTRSGVTLSRTYSYESSVSAKLLTGITDERGVRYATWAYDVQGRAVSSEHAGGVERSSIVYKADGSSVVTNALGKKTTYRFQIIEGVKRIAAIEGEPSANCPSSNSTFIYNDRGQVLTQTDAKGFITAHEYNDRGLETSRTEASGTPQARTTTTTWHATFNLPLTVTEPGQQTTYTYDAQGRQTSRTRTAL